MLSNHASQYCQSILMNWKHFNYRSNAIGTTIEMKKWIALIPMYVHLSDRKADLHFGFQYNIDWYIDHFGSQVNCVYLCVHFLYWFYTSLNWIGVCWALSLVNISWAEQNEEKNRFEYRFALKYEVFPDALYKGIDRKKK